MIIKTHYSFHDLRIITNAVLFKMNLDKIVFDVLNMHVFLYICLRIQPHGGLLCVQVCCRVWRILPVLLYRENPEDDLKAEGPGELGLMVC